MKSMKLRNVTLVLAIFVIAAGLAYASPALAQRSSGSGSGDWGEREDGYDYGRGSGSGCGEESEAAMGAQTSGGSGMNAPTIAAKVKAAPVGGRPLSATLSGLEEVPGPGDPDGTGSAFITLNQGQGLVCWELSATDITTATAAHIHVGEWGVAGPVVVTLSPPDDGSSTGCTEVDPMLIKDIRQNPENYYVNVHNAEFPSGAIRGQLGK